MHRSFFHLLGLAYLVTLALVLVPATSHAISFKVTVDTRPLAGQTTPPAPFSLEFQLNDGDGTVNNTVTLSNFNFGAGGSASGSPATTGGASGNLASTVTLTDSSFFNEFIQGFTPSSTGPLSFLIDLTTNVEPTTPDAFSFAIFDSSKTGLPTSFFDVFLQIDITNPLTITTYASDLAASPPGCPTCPPIEIDAPVISPEPSTLFLFGFGVMLLLTPRWLRQKTKEIKQLAAPSQSP